MKRNEMRKGISRMIAVLTAVMMPAVHRKR